MVSPKTGQVVNLTNTRTIAEHGPVWSPDGKWLVYARTDGYLKKWYFDIGAHVKAGQLLATIQAPEIDEQLAQAQSTLATAQANLKLAEITQTRYEAMFEKL